VIAIRDIATGVLYYKVADMHGVYHDFPRANVLHIKNRSEDGVYGLSTIQMARHDVDRQMQMQKFGSHFFRNQARPAGLLEHPGNLSKPAAERLRESWQATYAGAENAGKVAILEENMTFKQLTVAPADAQFIEQEGAGVIDIARWFNLPQHMLGAMNNATFSNMEQQALEFVRLTVFPEARRFEAAMNFQLLTPFERKKGYFIRYDLNGLLRADTATRFTSYAIGRQWGFYSADDVREIEHLNPIPDGAGEIYWQPTNMVDASEEKEDPQPLPAPGPGGLIQVPTTQPVQAPQPAGQGDAPGGAPVNTQPGKKPPGKRFAMDMIEFDMRHEPDKLFLIRTRKAYTRIFERQIGDLLTKEAKFVDRIAKKCAKDRDVGDFRKQVESFYVSHQPLCANAMLDPMIALGEQLGEMTSSNEVLMRKLSENWAEDHCRTNRERVIDLIEKMPASDLLPAINELAKQWQEREFAKLAEKEVTTVLNTLEIAA
jgi:HK97 family phage portal protein